MTSHRAEVDLDIAANLRDRADDQACRADLAPVGKAWRGVSVDVMLDERTRRDRAEQTELCRSLRSATRSRSRAGRP